jgi:hypothetical protein
LTLYTNMSRQYESSSDAGTNNNAATSGFFYARAPLSPSKILR